MLLKINPQTLLKIGFTSGTKLKNLTARTARLKPLNKTKQNYTKKTLVNLKRTLLSILNFTSVFFAYFFDQFQFLKKNNEETAVVCFAGLWNTFLNLKKKKKLFISIFINF